MYHSFRRSKSKTAQRARRKTVSALSSLWGEILTPVAPKKRAAVQKKKPAAQKPARSVKARVTSRRQTKPNAKPAPPATSRARTKIPSGASFKKGVHESEHGKRSFMVYVPAAKKTAKKPLPVVVMLHGCNQTPLELARGTGMNVLAEEFGFLVVYPAQGRKSQTNRCWNWFKRGDQARGAGEPAQIASLTRHIIAHYQADPARVYIAGLSAGASTALITAGAYPDIFAAVGAHSGLPTGAAHDTVSALVAMKYGTPGQAHTVALPTIDFHGDADTVVNPRNGRSVAARAAEPYANLQKTEKIGYGSGGRKYVRTSYRLGKGRSFVEHWVVIGAGHAWSGGNTAGSYTDPLGPDASREMVRFFLRHRTTQKWRASFNT